VKILLVSDLHYALKQFDWTVAAAPEVDLVVIAGDHVDIAGRMDGGMQVVVILKYLRKLAASAKLIVSSGNHDLDQRDASGEKIPAWMAKVRALGAVADGDSIYYGDMLVTVCPWWDGPHAKQAVADQLARDAAREKQKWLWVYHGPPPGPTSWNGRQDCGDTDLAAWIAEYSPDIVFTGHIHEAPFKQGGSWTDRIGDTWVFNSGRQIGPTPAHIFVDTEANEAAWFSQAGAESVQLSAPLMRPIPEMTALPAWMPAGVPA
jgi:Icc-related predicted phosphoesterase